MEKAGIKPQIIQLGAAGHQNFLIDVFDRLEFKSKLKRLNYFIGGSVLLESIHLILYLLSCRRKSDFKQQLYDLKLEESVLLPLFDLCFSKLWDADDELANQPTVDEHQALAATLGVNRPRDARNPVVQNRLTNLDSIRILFFKVCSSVCEGDPQEKARSIFISDMEKEKYHSFLQSFLCIPESIQQQGWKAKERFRAESKHKLQERMFFYKAKQEPIEQVIIPNSVDVQLLYSRK